MKYNLLEDISTLSSIKTGLIEKLNSISEYCICDYVDNLSILDEDVVEIDIGIGKLNICVLDNEIQYQFKPSNRLEKNLLCTIMDNENPLTINVEQNLEKKFLNTYKGLF